MLIFFGSFLQIFNWQILYIPLWEKLDFARVGRVKAESRTTMHATPESRVRNGSPGALQNFEISDACTVCAEMLLTDLTGSVSCPAWPDDGGSVHSTLPKHRTPGLSPLPCPQPQGHPHLRTLATPQPSFLSLIALLPVQATCACSNQHHSS